MSVDRTFAVVRRVVRQLRRDHRTLAMLFLIPPLLLWLTSEVYAATPLVFDRVGPLLLGLFPFTLMFLVTSISVLRERTQGTLDRLMASPIGRGDLLVGYALALTLVALAQAAVALAVGLWLLDLPSAGSLGLTFAVVAIQALLGIALGLFLSAFARNEFQAVQFLPAVVVPQVFLAGLLVPVERLPRVLEGAAQVLPLTYAFEVLDLVMVQGRGLGDDRVALDFAVLALAVTLFLAAGALTLRRTEG